MSNATPECWLPLPGYEGLYEVSDLGRIWSKPRPRTKGGILKQSTTGRGYRYDNENTIVENGGRYCRKCRRKSAAERTRRYRERRAQKKQNVA